MLAEDIDRFERWSNDIALDRLADPHAQAGRERSACHRGVVRLLRDHRGGTVARAPGPSRQRSAGGRGGRRQAHPRGAAVRHPDQLQRLREALGLLDPAVDEPLRFESPVQLDGRVVREDLEMGGKRLRAGQKAIALLGAANRDPAAFENPDALDIGRKERSHLSCGRDIHYCLSHYCLGVSLAVLEARIAFRGLLDRFPSINLAAEPRFRDGIVLRGAESLWIEVEQTRQPAGICHRPAPNAPDRRGTQERCARSASTAPPNPYRHVAPPDS